MTTHKPHEALHVPLAERVDYLMIIASMAGVDVVLTPEEIAKLKELCRELDLPERETGLVLAAAHRPTAMVARHLDSLKSSALRFALLSDCLALAHADGDYALGEKKEIHALSRALGVDDAQLSALEECAQALRDQSAPHHHETLGARLAAVGIPVGVVATLSAAGLTTAGVSSGAAALVAGLGIATGFGAVLGLGVGTVIGVRWLHDKLERHD